MHTHGFLSRYFWSRRCSGSSCLVTNWNLIEWSASPLPLWHFRKHMKRINFAVTVDELRLLASLASDQLFRRQFIDPKMPGYKGNPEEVALGKALVGRMRLMIDGGTRPYQIGRA